MVVTNLTKKGYSSPCFTDIASAYGIEAHRIDNAESIDRVFIHDD